MMQCSPYQAVTGKIYCLKQHFLLPATAQRFTQVVIRSDPHKKMNEHMEKYSYLSTKPTAQKIMRVQELLFASTSWKLRAAFCRALALESSKTQELFCGYKFNHKNFFAVGFLNRSATTSFSAVKLP